ncbi:MAG: lipoate--protein ligase family protein [Candidatus Sumerlaeaceae bacterium]|nr:lipoate--protein ligase family protein [Candidatus Sumerlaeaceae bacterium]
MLTLDLTLPTPEENLALDEALLDEAEAGGGPEVLRFWESDRHFVVLGAGCALREDVIVPACRADGIPILRRASGGGTIVQGPGCLNYALVLDRIARPEVSSIRGTNHYVLDRVGRACAMSASGPATRTGFRLMGICDLVGPDGLKFSGNAQKRKKRFVLFHGTVLYNLDLSLLGRYLKEPPRQPEYRAGRSHDQFVGNIEIEPYAFRAAMRAEWEVTGDLAEWPRERVHALIRGKYARDEYTLLF